MSASIDPDFIRGAVWGLVALVWIYIAARLVAGAIIRTVRESRKEKG